MKKFIAIILAATMMLALCACNYDLIDTHYDFRYAVIQRYDGEQLIEIAQWKDFEDGDQIQITSTDGITYILHSSQVILLSDKEK